jgi:hypothetical protein
LVALDGIGGGPTTGTPPDGVVTGNGGRLCVDVRGGGGGPERLAPVSLRVRMAALLPRGGPIGELLALCAMGGLLALCGIGGLLPPCGIDGDDSGGPIGGEEMPPPLALRGNGGGPET